MPKKELDPRFRFTGVVLWRADAFVGLQADSDCQILQPATR